jgi:protein involved in polysaccharide export with SLBB domain
MRSRTHLRHSILIRLGLPALLSFTALTCGNLQAQDSKDSKEQPAAKSMAASFVNSMALLNDEYKLGPGDLLSFRVLEDEDPAKHVPVMDSGEADIPFLGRLNVTGRSCKAVASEIKTALEKQFYIRATVILCLDTMGPKHAAVAGSRGKIYLMGQVRAQGPQEIPPDETFTVSKAILRAGGFSDYANKRKVKVIRQSGKKGTSDIKIIDLVDVLEKGKVEKDMVVEPEDLIIVPERIINF